MSSDVQFPEAALLLEIARRRKLLWFGRGGRKPDSLAHCEVIGARKPKRTWLTDIAERTGIRIMTCRSETGKIEATPTAEKGYGNDYDYDFETLFETNCTLLFSMLMLSNLDITK